MGIRPGSRATTVGGVDFNYRDTEIIPGKTIQADLYYERSFSDIVGDDHSYAAAFNYPNEPWFGEFTYKVVGGNFAPALGFVNRNDVKALRRYGRISRAVPRRREILADDRY